MAHEARERAVRVGLARRGLGSSGEFLEALLDDGREQRVLRRVVTEHGADADARTLRNGVDGNVDSALGEDLARRAEDAPTIAHGVEPPDPRRRLRLFP